MTNGDVISLLFHLAICGELFHFNCCTCRQFYAWRSWWVSCFEINIWFYNVCNWTRVFHVGKLILHELSIKNTSPSETNFDECTIIYIVKATSALKRTLWWQDKFIIVYLWSNLFALLFQSEHFKFIQIIINDYYFYL